MLIYVYLLNLDSLLITHRVGYIKLGEGLEVRSIIGYYTEEYVNSALFLIYSEVMGVRISPHSKLPRRFSNW